MTEPYREIDAGRELLDHQLVDVDGLLFAKVDDVEFTVPDDGELPEITALLNGPGALANRIGGRVAHGVSELHRRLHPTLDDAARIPIGLVVDIGSAIKISGHRDDLESGRFEEWVRDHVITRIPGANDAPE
jgi:hypothetical protein